MSAPAPKAFAGGAGDPSLAPKMPGAWVRGASNFQNWIAAGTEFPPEAGRYHLYFNYTCGWCHRILMVRNLKRLQSIISASPVMGKFVRTTDGTDEYRGWGFSALGGPSPETVDPINNFQNTFEVYNSNNATYGNKQLAVPILFDKKLMKVVCNDNIQLAYILNDHQLWLQCPEYQQALSSPSSCLQGGGVAAVPELYPEEFRAEIDSLNQLIYPGINDGVYRVGFAKTKEIRDEMRKSLFAALDEVEAILRKSKEAAAAAVFYLVAGSSQPTLADVRAFPHLVRFDSCYFTVFECNTRNLKCGQYPCIMEWMRNLYAMPEVRETCRVYLATYGYHTNEKSLQAEKAKASWDAQKYDFLDEEWKLPDWA